MIRATHCVLPDEAITSLGPADWRKVYTSVFIYFSLFSSFFFIVLLFVLGQDMQESPKLDKSCRSSSAALGSSPVFALISSLICAFMFTSFLQVLIEATVSRERRGYIAIDDIMVLNYPCCKCHF